jgi:Rieske Fe-S protein
MHPNTSGDCDVDCGFACQGLVARRSVLIAAAASSTLAIAGCSGYGAASTAAPARSSTSSGSGAPTAVALVKVGDVPVGGGTILADQQVVVTQPRAGLFVVLGSACTHQGCQVTSVDRGLIRCACHGSAFTLTGEVSSGPARQALPAQPYAVKDGVITLSLQPS